MSTGFVYPIVSFSLLDYTKIADGAYFIGFNLDYPPDYPLCRMDNTGAIDIIGGGGGGTSGTSGTSGTGGGGGGGTSGTSGVSGTSGTSGSSGSSGSSGTSGNGTSGSSGTSGTAGSSGTNGTSGSSGSSGTSGTSGTGGTGVEFYFQQNAPSPNPTAPGARWIDSDNGIEYVWVFDGTAYSWMQPTQLGSVQYHATVIPTATYAAGFAYEYYGVIYSLGICTVTLPAGASPADDGRFLTVADEVGGISAGNRGILVQGTGGQLINGHASILMQIERMSLTFLFRNNSWKTI